MPELNLSLLKGESRKNAQFQTELQGARQGLLHLQARGGRKSDGQVELSAQRGPDATERLQRWLISGTKCSRGAFRADLSNAGLCLYCTGCSLFRGKKEMLISTVNGRQ